MQITHVGVVYANADEEQIDDHLEQEKPAEEPLVPQISRKIHKKQYLWNYFSKR